MLRIFDISLSLVALIVLSPILISTIIILRLTGEGQIIYTQKRIGLHEKEIKILKFATMLQDSPRLGAGNITLKDDPRVLPFGKILRKTKINELPQLVNILRGDMSLVGPRPLTQDMWQLYTHDQKSIIRKVTPGLTGAGSIYFRDEEKYFPTGTTNHRAIYVEKILPIKASLELWYAENKGIRTYFKIILLTAFAVLFKNSKFPAKILMREAMKTNAFNSGSLGKS